MAGAAVLIAPVSQANSLQTGNLTGKYSIFRLWRPTSKQKSAVLQQFFVQFPNGDNRENNARNRELLNWSREFRSGLPVLST
jgi:hypothetical protein